MKNKDHGRQSCQTRRYFWRLQPLLFYINGIYVPEACRLLFYRYFKLKVLASTKHIRKLLIVRFF